MFLMIGAGQLMPGDKRPQWEFAETVSDNCSITRPVGQFVWEGAVPSLKMKTYQIRGGL